jgi:hypothetical protein
VEEKPRGVNFWLPSALMKSARHERRAPAVIRPILQNKEKSTNIRITKPTHGLSRNVSSDWRWMRPVNRKAIQHNVRIQTFTENDFAKIFIFVLAAVAFLKMAFDWYRDINFYKTANWDFTKDSGRNSFNTQWNSSIRKRLFVRCKIKLCMAALVKWRAISPY